MFCGVQPPGNGLHYDMGLRPLGGCGAALGDTAINVRWTIEGRVIADIMFHEGCAPEGRVPLFSRGYAAEQAARLARERPQTPQDRRERQDA